MKRERYLEKIRPKPCKIRSSCLLLPERIFTCYYIGTTADRQILKGVVISEQKRRYALELKERYLKPFLCTYAAGADGNSSGQIDVLDAVQANPDFFYESMDAVDLDWEKVANKVNRSPSIAI